MAIKGLKETLTALKRFGEEAEKEVNITTAATSLDIAAMAKSNAPIDLGKLRQSISSVEVSKETYKVIVLAPYGAYIEFGTGRKISVPDELKDVAIQFKGAGVKEINIMPQPYLYPSFVKGRKKYLEDLEALLNDLTNKYD